MQSIRSAIMRIRASRRADDQGASLVEYALLLALIAVVCIAAVSFLGASTSNKFSQYGGCVGAAGTAAPMPVYCK